MVSWSSSYYGYVNVEIKCTFVSNIMEMLVYIQSNTQNVTWNNAIIRYPVSLCCVYW